MTDILITTQNPYNSAGQATVNGFFNNLSYDPTVEELNRTISSSREAVQPTESEAEEPAFGTHLREAAGTVKKLFGR
jgi:hypothetical protein